MASGDRYAYRGKPSGILATSNSTETARAVPDPFYEGLVVDVVLDHMHPQYAKDGYNVGSIKVRIFSIHNSRSDELLDWADPLDSTIQEMPLIGELVMVHKILGNFFYTRKVFLAHRLQENGMLRLNDALNNRAKQLKSNASSAEEITIEKHKFGQYFKPDSRVRQLKHFEGDVIIQGRMGNSIRFGSSQMDPSSNGMAPSIILRTGQGKDIEKTDSTREEIFGLILEDINKDASSIWMLADQTVPFEPTTINAGSFYRSITNPPQKFDKAHIILNSDRLILNAKKTHIMLFSNEEIYLNSFKKTSIDTDDSIVLTANIDIQQKAGRNIDISTDEDFTIKTGKDISFIAAEKLSFTAKKIHFGGMENDVEPMVGGTSLAIFLARLIQALMGIGTTTSQVPPYQSTGAPQPPIQVPRIITPGPAATGHVITPAGPGMLSPVVTSALTALYKELVNTNPGSTNPLTFSGAPFNSYDAFVGMSNQDASTAIVKNEFESGNQTTTENGEWVLTDTSYYKVL